jgi:hypothetical protein
MPIGAAGHGKKYVTRAELDEYMAATIARLRRPFYVERRFRTNEEWDRVSAYEFRNIRAGMDRRAIFMAHETATMIFPSTTLTR